MKRSLSIMLFLFLSLSLAQAQEVQQKVPEKTRILFLMDGSGSMFAKWGPALRIEVARKILSDLIDSLRVDDKVEVALRAYGHQFPVVQQNCEDSKLVVGFQPNNHDLIIQRIQGLVPKGVTPIAYSLKEAANDFPADPKGEYRNIIIIITDGIESCDGDPCEVSLALQRKNIFLKPFVIGMGMEEKYQQQFDCMGSYFNAKNIRSFRSVLNGILKQSLEETTASVELLDIEGRKQETNVNVSFINNFTGIAEFDFVHYRDRNGKPDTVQVDPVLTYDVVVNTIPPVIKQNVFLKGGTHNVISIKSPQGSLRIDMPNAREYDGTIHYLIRKAGTERILHTASIDEPVKLLVGQYDIEVLSLPRREFKNIAINQSRTTTLKMTSPGRLNISYYSNGIGSLYELNEKGKQRWIKDINPSGNKLSFGIQPGRYKYVFRSEKALGSKYTQIKEFTVRSGATRTVKIY